MNETSAEEWSRKSWVESAKDASCGFPLQSLPYCIFALNEQRARPGVGIGAMVLDLEACSRSGLFAGLPDSVLRACQARTLNPLIACGPAAHGALRGRLMDLLDADTDQATQDAVGAFLVVMERVALLRPVEPANYTDFYASLDHAARVGRLFRPENPLLPNYMYVPIGYHGRASSIVVSGTPIRRPSGQSRPAAPGGEPGFGPSKSLDYELEVGMYIAEGNPLGEPIPVREARDIQSWEYQPLGPFLGKSFATSVSAWVIPMAALEPFRTPADLRRPDSPGPLGYLFDTSDQSTGAFNLSLEVFLLTPAMRAAGQASYRLSQGNLAQLWWTPAQLVAHHTSNGCNLLPGDLLATGTVSGPEDSSAGCLLELTAGGAKPIALPNGETRTALEDGDEVILRGVCRKTGYPDVSLGECRGTVLPAIGSL
jgi:fumarylacetoacetase